MKASLLNQMKQSSPLRSMKVIRPDQSNRQKKSLFFSLNLTTLIDAFCILVIFLLSNMNGRLQNIQQKDRLVLPAALKSEIIEDGLVVRIEQQQYYLDNRLVAKNNILKALFDIQKLNRTSLIIQADRNSAFENIAFILKAAGQAGIEKYAFAVLPGT